MARTDGRSLGHSDVPPGLRLLVVEDNRDAAESLAILLGLWGHRARVAYAADAALRAVADERPDGVLLDLGLPRRDGFDLAAQLRARDATRDVKLYAVSGHSVYRDQALGGPFDDFLLKPFDPDALRKLLAEVQTSGGAARCDPHGDSRGAAEVFAGVSRPGRA